MTDKKENSGAPLTNGTASDPVCSSDAADLIKDQANKLFNASHYEESIALYSQAISLNSEKAEYFANRSFAYLKTEFYGLAIEDASTAIKIRPSYCKAYYRRAAAQMALGKFKLALKDFERASQIAPNDMLAKQRVDECRKIIKMAAFAKAIAVESTVKSAADSIDLEGMSIEDDYSGPQLEDGRVTLQFVKDLIEAFRKQQKLHKKHAYKILLEVQKLFMSQPSLIDIDVKQGAKFTICGDVHGQFYDLLTIFDLNGLPSEENPYLFNGDFVDRGSFSVETIFTLFSLKLLYPTAFFMSRGNHESATMNQMYGFEGEVKAKYSSHMAELFTEIYNWLPLAHVINKKIFVCHGGLFKEDGVTLDDIRKVDRNRQPPEEDPQPALGRSASKRGTGIQFGPDITEKFCSENGLLFVVRSHEVKNEGYEVVHNGKCITVFSAPNYCDVMGNKASFMTVTGGKEKDYKMTQFEAVDHPNVRPMAYSSSVFGLG